MDWKRIAPWNWFKDEEASVSTTPSAGMTHLSEVADPISALRAEMDRLFNESFGSALSTRPGHGSLHRGASGPLRPHVDISEGEKAYTVRADLPGVSREDVALELDGQTLAIRAERNADREEEDEHYHYVERSRGSVQRVLSLPDDADVDSIDARFKNGVLELRIPKHPAKASGGRNIEIQAG
jgi:HSP20 family protein